MNFLRNSWRYSYDNTKVLKVPAEKVFPTADGSQDSCMQKIRATGLMLEI
jgi:hypothetical protein